MSFFNRTNLNLIREFTATDFKLFYKNSFLGYLWSLLNPLLLFGTLYFVFTIFVRFGDVPHYQLYLLLGIILWGFLASSTQASLDSILSKGSLIKKVYFPRAIIIISSCLTGLISLLLNLLVFTGFCLVARVSLSSTAFWFPLFVVELFFLTLGLAFFLSALYVKFRDVSHIWQVVLSVGFWLTPIIYPLDLVPARFSWVLWLNPMAAIIISSRNCLIYGIAPSSGDLLLTLCFSLLVFLGGIYVFLRRAPYFAEEL